MPFFKKLLFYLFGVTLGIFAVIFMFGDRDIQCSYFPNDRVLYDLRKKEAIISEEMWREMEYKNIEINDLEMMLLNGDVNFKKSKTERKPCKSYWVDYQTETKRDISAEWGNCDSTRVLLGIHSNG